MNPKFWTEWNSRRVGAAALALVSGFCASCAGDSGLGGGDLEVGQTRQAAAITAFAGAVPIPAVSGSLKPSWNGTYPELLAADALAECALTQQVGITDGGTSDTDVTLLMLSQKISAAQCSAVTATPPAGYTPVEAFYWKWLEGRKITTCNVDLTTQSNRALDLSYAPSTSPTYALPPLTTYQGTSIGAAYSGAELNQARTMAQNNVHYAWLNLCMAQKLRSQLDSSQVALTSQGDLLQLQTLVQQRAQAAVYQYANLVKSIGDTPSTMSITNPWQFTNLIAGWKDKCLSFDWTNRATAIGRDIANAVSLLIEATGDRTDIMLRSSGVQKRMGTYTSIDGLSTFDPAVPLDGILTGPRVDAMLAAYGAYWDAVPRAPITDMHAPEIGVLFGMARAQGALKLTGANKTFDIVANSAAILAAAEAFERKNLCIENGDTTTACYDVPPGTPPEAYYIQWLFHIEPKHGQALVRAMLEQLYGRPKNSGYSDTGPWTYRLDGQNVMAGLPLDTLDRFTGTHTYTGDFSTSSGGTLTLDNNVTVASPNPVALQGHSWAHVPQRGITFHPYDQGYDYRMFKSTFFYNEPAYATNAGALRPGSPLGSQSVLAYLRYALSRSNVAASPTAPIVAGAGSQLWDFLRQAVGSRQAVIRRTKAAATSTTNCTNWRFIPTGGSTFTTPANCTVTANVNGTSAPGPGPTIDVYVNTTSTDPYTTLSYRAANTSPLSTSGTRVTFAGTVETVDSNVSSVTGEVIRKYTVAVPANMIAELRLETANGSDGVPLFRGKFDEPATFPPGIAFDPTGYQAQNAATFARSVTYGGTLNQRMDHALSFSPQDWSRPAYDAFDFPSDWSPIGDASLFGGQTGQEAYQFFLQSAQSAAKDATTAVDKAFQSLSDQVNDTLALQQADDQGKTINALQTKSLCGEAKSCKIGYTPAPVTIANCLSNTFCPGLRGQLQKMFGTAATTGGIPLADDVYSQRDSVLPNFDKYKGGQVQALLLAQFNAWKALGTAITNAIAAASTAGTDAELANAEVTASDAEYTAAQAEVFDAVAALALQNVTLTQQQNTITNQANQFQQQLDTANAQAKYACGPDAYNAAVDASVSYSGQNRSFAPKFEGNGGFSYTVGSGDSRSISPAPLEAMHEVCRQANITAGNAQALLPDAIAGMKQSVEDVQNAIAAHNLTQYVNLTSRLNAAFARHAVAPIRAWTAFEQAASTGITQLGLVQQAIGNLKSTGAALDAAVTQASNATAKEQLDQTIQQQDIKTRFNVRRSFHSYDLWRARALSENARRLAIAARRAIESRFVVDLSALNADETFVEAPAVWSDGIYDSDLKPPSSLGRTSGPASAGTTAIYSSAIEDYVNNLQLFVNGYAVSRPTAVQRSDADVIQLPGPATIAQVTASSDLKYAVRDPGSAGWSFLCPGNFFVSEYWTNNPHSAAFDSNDWSLSTLCNGGPPIRAKLTFWLDPWGVLNGFQELARPASRHNARWRTFSVNVVGTGIRDCSQVSDPAACYQEPFLRYNLRHVGPAQVTDYNEVWQPLQLPAGNVEGGKALAAEEWLDPVANGFQSPLVSNVARQEFAGRPLGGRYELILELTPDVRPENIDRIQLLLQTDYWVRQQ